MYLCQTGLEIFREAIRGQKEIEAGIDQVAHLVRVEHTACEMDEIGLNVERSIRELLPVVLANQGGDLFSQRSRGHIVSFTVRHVPAIPRTPPLRSEYRTERPSTCAERYRSVA